MNEIEERVTINEQNKIEMTICLLINTDMQLFCFQGSVMWLCCKWKETYDCQIYVVILMFIISR